MTVATPSTAISAVVCSGAPRDMGLAQGRRLANQITAAHTALEVLESFRIEQPRWLPFSWFRRLAERRAAVALDRPLATRFPRSRDRLLGIAEGAAVRPATIYLLNAIESLLSAVREHVVYPPPGACSAVAVRGSRSVDGDPVIAKNFDYLPLVQPFFTLRESRPHDGLRSLEFTVAPLAGTVDGINERGLCICNNYAFTTDGAAATATLTMLVAEALQRCETVSEAAAWISDQPRWGAGILMLADAAGDIASLEISSTRSHLRRPEPGQDTLFHTNKFTHPRMCDVQVPLEAVFGDRAPRSLRGTRLHESAEVRDCRLAELLDSAEPIGPEQLAALLADHGRDGVPNDNTLCVHSDYWNTTATMQFFPRRRALRIDFAPACQARFHELQLSP